MQNAEGSRRTVALLERNDLLHYGRGLGLAVWAAASRSLVPVAAGDTEDSASGGAVFRCELELLYITAITSFSVTETSLISI